MLAQNVNLLFILEIYILKHFLAEYYDIRYSLDPLDDLNFLDGTPLVDTDLTGGTDLAPKVTGTFWYTI